MILCYPFRLNIHPHLYIFIFADLFFHLDHNVKEYDHPDFSYQAGSQTNAVRISVNLYHDV